MKPYKETIYKDALIYACGRWADAYLPPDYTQADVQEALQELVWKANQLDGDEDDDKYGPRFDPSPEAVNRPSRRAFHRKFY